MSNFEQEKNAKALVWTIAVHAVVIVALLFLGFKQPPPPSNTDLGMEINLGTAPEGTGNDQPLNPNLPSMGTPTPSTAQNVPTPSVNNANTENIATQDEEEAPVIKHPEKAVKKNTMPPKTFEEKTTKTSSKATNRPPVEAKPAPPKPKAVYSGGSTANPNSGNNAEISNNARGEGLTGKAGDQGAVNGNPNAANHNGTWSGQGGNGINHNLRGRRIIRYPSIDDQFEEAGKVAVDVKVDREGNIISATPALRGSTTANPTLRALAMKAAKQIKFDPNPDAAEEQFGTIIFSFKLH